MAQKRELIEPRKGDKRYVRRTRGGQFAESDDVGRSLSADKKRPSKTRSKPGQGDRGDRRPSARTKTATKTSSRKAASTRGRRRRAQ